MDENEILAQFDNWLRGSYGHERFTANSFLDLLHELRDGAARMVREGRTSRNDMNDALAALGTLLGEMATMRDQLGYSEFREDTVHRAKFSICPIWPFC